MIGIVGGMGPQAGINLFNSILSHTGAATDQGHLSVMLMSFPKHIVDRTEFLEGREQVNPAYNVAQVIGKLEAAGAKLIGLACNTVHAPGIFEVIQEELQRMNSRVKLLNMPLETCRLIGALKPGIRRVGIMTTNGTYKSGIYQQLLSKAGHEVITPDPVFQDKVIHRMIYDPQFGIKSNPNIITPEVRQLLDKTLRYFEDRQTGAIILGCTELSLLLREKKARNMLVIDSTEALAKALVNEAIGSYKPAGLKQLNEII